MLGMPMSPSTPCRTALRATSVSGAGAGLVAAMAAASAADAVICCGHLASGFAGDAIGGSGPIGAEAASCFGADAEALEDDEAEEEDAKGSKSGGTTVPRGA